MMEQKVYVGRFFVHSFWDRIKDAWRVLVGKSFAVHSFSDEKKPMSFKEMLAKTPSDKELKECVERRIKELKDVKPGPLGRIALVKTEEGKVVESYPRIEHI